MNSTKKTARIAGLLYLLMGVTSTLSLNIPSAFIIRGDAAATADKIASSQLFYRLCVISDLVAQILFVGIARKSVESSGSLVIHSTTPFSV